MEVHVLSDLLDIRNDEWRNAVEGYLAGSKLSLVVAPAYAKTAMEIYGELDRREYWNVAVLDTEKAVSYTHLDVYKRQIYHQMDQSEPVPAPGLQQSDGICGQNRELL